MLGSHRLTGKLENAYKLLTKLWADLVSREEVHVGGSIVGGSIVGSPPHAKQVNLSLNTCGGESAMVMVIISG